MVRWWIGCSGFYYKEWREKFYPADLSQRKWFEFYCEHFNTLELNVTFYRFPHLNFLKNWHAKSPRTFRFSVKAPRLITHYKKFTETKKLLADFYSVIHDGLMDKLGCVLFQMPPKMEYSREKLDQITRNLDPNFSNVIEFRHESWWNEEVIAALRDRKITFCSISYPSLPDDVVRTSDIIYYRFHGVPELYRSPYSEEFMGKIKDKIAHLDQNIEAYIYFNNDVGASAINNAKQLQMMTSD